MGYMEMSGTKRTISFSPSSAYYAKNSMGLEEVIEIPGIQATNNFIKDVIVSAIKSRREQDEAQSGPYDELIKTINDTVNAAQNIAAVNEAYGKLAALEHIWDSKLYAWSKINEAAKRINAVWDRTAKRFAVSTPPQPESLRKGTKTDGNLQADFNFAKGELENIMTSVDSRGKAVFNGEEWVAMRKIVTGLKAASVENLGIITRLIEEKKLSLMERLSAIPVGAEENPTPVAENHTDDFEDDIPFENRNVKTKPATAELEIF
jgi:hypothetical protein